MGRNKIYMKGYKAFKKGLICSPQGNTKQYKENTIFEENDANICSNGMHFCKEPLAVLNYYPLVDDEGNMSEFAEVEALDECKTNDEEKYCTKKLKIKGKISFAQLVQASVDFDYQKIIKDNIDIENDNGGNSAQIGSSGDSAQIGSSGNSAQIGSSGYYAKIGSSGDSAQIGSSGDSAQIDLNGNYSVGMCAGMNCKIKGKKGNWITLAEWEWNDQINKYIPICVKSAQIDGKILKEDTYYTLKDGEFKEC